MSTLKDYVREVRDAAVEHLEARHRDTAASAATQHLPREEALATIALVTIRLLEQQLQSHATDGAAQAELQAHLKACRKALKSHKSPSSAAEVATEGNAASLKRSRAEETNGKIVTASSSASAASGDPATSVELGQYSTTNVFGQNMEKRLKFARLMGGAKAATAAAENCSSNGSRLHHNTHAKSGAEVRRMNDNLEREFESAMAHKGKKGLGA